MRKKLQFKVNLKKSVEVVVGPRARKGIGMLLAHLVRRVFWGSRVMGRMDQKQLILLKDL